MSGNDSFTISSFCTGGGCVEVGHVPDGVIVRDAKDPLRTVALRVGATSWGAFLEGIRRGDFPGAPRP